MRRFAFFPFAILALFQCIVVIALSSPSLAQEWSFRVKPRGTLRVVDLTIVGVSVMLNYAEGLVALDKDNNWIPGLAEDYRWVDERTIEFKLRHGVKFHNGEKFNSEAVRVNWEAYRKMESPRPHWFKGYTIPDETILKIIDEYTVRFTLPQRDGLVFVKFHWFYQFAPAFFAEHTFDEKSWGYLREAGPWGTGPFEFVEGGLGVPYGPPSDQVVLKANGAYWDPRYPKVKKVIFVNTLLGNRKEAMRLCRESEGSVDTVSYIRPLDTLKVAESPFAKVMKSKDVSALAAIINMRKKDSKLRDLQVRKALNYAINREELWKYAAKANAHNLAGHIPPEAYGHNPNLTLYTYDTDKARSLLAEAGCSDGFELKIFAHEGWSVPAQILGKMLERVGIKAKIESVTTAQMWRRIYIPSLERPPEEQYWDLCLLLNWDWTGHTGITFFTFGLLEGYGIRWIEYDETFENMWNQMAGTVYGEAQEEKIRRIEQYVYDKAYRLYFYSPLTLYAVNKAVNFVPQKCQWLRLKETSVTDSHWSIRGENQ